jgi:hypothetical protein
MIGEGMHGDIHCSVLAMMQKCQGLVESPAVRIAEQDALPMYET